MRLRRDGSLDRTFGIRGKRLTRPGAHGGSGGTVLQQADGRIVVGGRIFEDDRFDTSDWLLARYTRGGALDRTFGRGGLVVTDFGTGADWVGALALQRDAKIVAAGSIYESQALARYRP